MFEHPLLVIGLGNPGKRYNSTRHNAGFMVLDWLCERWNASPFQEESKFSAEATSLIQGTQKIILAKPTTFMNESGRSVQSLLDYYKLGPQSLVIIHDDLDIAPGTLRTTDSSRAAGHNGVQNIIDTLGTQDFFRIRLGIGRPGEVQGTCIPSHDYVLGRFLPDEEATLRTLFPAVEEAILNRSS